MELVKPLTRIDPSVSPFVLTGNLSENRLEITLYNLIQGAA